MSLYSLVVPLVYIWNLAFGSNNNILMMGVGNMQLTTTPHPLRGTHFGEAIKVAGNNISSSCKNTVITGIYKPDEALRTKHCCPPDLGKTVQPFVFPTTGNTTMRKRWPAHRGTKEQVEDYIAAIKAMRKLDVDDPNHPHSFTNQAKIHCAYCHGSYSLEGLEIQIHNSWLFFPFHRWYLYYYERILGKLIGKPDTFALPYWQWDHPDGMHVPKMFLTQEALFEDVYRDSDNMRRGLVDLNFYGKDEHFSDEKLKGSNLVTVYRDLIRNGGDTTSFFGGKYVAGDAPDNKEAQRPTSSLEAGSHTAVHRWVGDHTKPNTEDMGRFYSAGYDPLFYVHHANVDRMWKLWKDMDGHNEPTDKDWEDASYVFYDENLNLVRVTNKDSVELDKLQYGYIEGEGPNKEVFPWHTQGRPARRNPSSQVASTVRVPIVEQLKFPLKLNNKILKVRVKRPAVNRTEHEKKNANEVLFVNDIKFNRDKFVKFDVFVNDKLKEGEAPVTTCDPEYAGGFAQIPHGNIDEGMLMPPGAARFGLTEILEDTNTQGEEYVTLTLVPREGCKDLTIGEIEIDLILIIS